MRKSRFSSCSQKPHKFQLVQVLQICWPALQARILPAWTVISKFLPHSTQRTECLPWFWHLIKNANARTTAKYKLPILKTTAPKHPLHNRRKYSQLIRIGNRNNKDLQFNAIKSKWAEWCLWSKRTVHRDGEWWGGDGFDRENIFSWCRSEEQLVKKSSSEWTLATYSNLKLGR